MRMKMKNEIKHLFGWPCLALLFGWLVAGMVGCNHPEPEPPVPPTPTPFPPDTTVVPTPEALDSLIGTMSLREKVGQMFVVRPECLDTTIDMQGDYVSLQLRSVNEVMKKVSERYPVGGVILYAHNIQDATQLTKFVQAIHALPGLPRVCIDEEGGRVARIANNPNFYVTKYESMAAIGASGDSTKAYRCGKTIGTYLHRYGIDVNFAPVADVNTNPENIVIGNRAFSDDPKVAAVMVRNYLQGMKEAGVTGCIKHFPGHGDTKNDTHYGYAQTLKTWDQMLDCELIPFKAGIAWGCQLVMSAHIACPNVTGSEIPSTMSSLILQDKLRGELGYENLIITDAMEMGAITQQYSPEGATVGCVQAGVDLVLGPKDFTRSFNALVKAVEEGKISEDRIDESVKRILKVKYNL